MNRAAIALLLCSCSSGEIVIDSVFDAGIDAAPEVQCKDTVDCDDGDPCTSERCTKGGTCDIVQRTPGVECQDKGVMGHCDKNGQCL